jgi:arylsulfatase
MARADRLMVPAINGRSYVIEADVDFSAGDAQGAILAFGNRFGGIALYAAQSDIRFDYIYSEATTSSLRTPQPVGRGKVRVQFELTGPRSGRFILEVNGQRCGELELGHVWTTYGITAGLTCGYLNVPIVPDCAVPGVFTGTISRVTLDLLPLQQPQAGGFTALMQEE